MSTTFLLVLMIVIVDTEANDDVYSDLFDNSDQQKDEESGWADEALLDVAFYLRMHKFNEFDRRYYMKIDENTSYFYAQFPVPPLLTFHWEVYEKCSKDVFVCLMYLRDVVAETQLQRTSSTNHVMRRMNWTWERQGALVRMVDDECKRLKALDETRPEPFRGPLDRFRWRATASYFMCWYSMQNITLLSRFNESCDDIGECYQSTNISDWRADNSLPYQCALYSFCPDPCCSLRQVEHPAACQSVDPCQHTEIAENTCKFVRSQNTWFPSIIYNEWNVSCKCSAGYEWDSRYGICVDVDECVTGSDTCDTKSETCMNLPGRFKCICRWGFMWSTDDRTCVPDVTVKNAEIRFGLRYDSGLTPSASIDNSVNTNWFWNTFKNVWHKYRPSWLF